jgi:hypothetical protein
MMTWLPVDIINHAGKIIFVINLLPFEIFLKQTAGSFLLPVNRLSVGDEKLAELFADHGFLTLWGTDSIPLRDGIRFRFGEFAVRLNPNQQMKMIRHQTKCIGLGITTDVFIILAEKIFVVAVLKENV